jgi:hypothetical protein
MRQAVLVHHARTCATRPWQVLKGVACAHGPGKLDWQGGFEAQHGYDRCFDVQQFGIVALHCYSYRADVCRHRMDEMSRTRREGWRITWVRAG